MTPAVEIARAGPACSVQDAGRHGFLRFGVTPAGPMDWTLLDLANRLAGNAPGAAVIEAGPAGLTLVARGGPVTLGLAAPGFRVLRDGSALPSRACITLRPGAVLDLVPGRFGVWGCLAPAGGFAAAPVMGSLSTHARSGLGPFGGGPLRAGMVLPLAAATDRPETGLYAAPEPPVGPVRFISGPQDDLFVPGTVEGFAAADWTVAARSDRMAWRLEGPRLRHLSGHDIVSDGIPQGAIQVPGDGQPLVLMADAQTTGGYPKLGCVIRADLPVLAQTRPGQRIRFAPVDNATAVAALRAAQARVVDLAARARPMVTAQRTS